MLACHILVISGIIYLNSDDTIMSLVCGLYVFMVPTTLYSLRLMSVYPKIRGTTIIKGCDQ